MRPMEHEPADVHENGASGTRDKRGLSKKRLLGTAGLFILTLLLSACSYNAKLLMPEDAGQIPTGKYNLSAAVVVTPQQKNEQLELGIDISRFKLRPYPEMYLLMQSRLRSTFSTVDLVDEGSYDGKKYDVVINANANIAFQGGFQVNYQAKGVEPKSGFELFNTATARTEGYRLPGTAAVGAFLTGFTLFLASPITIPMSVNSIGEYSEKTYTNLLTSSFDETAATLNQNPLLKQYAATGRVPEPVSMARTAPPAVAPRGDLSADREPAVTSDIDALPPARVRSSTNAYAVIIGIERYRQKLPSADFATQDARLVNNYLTRVLGYPEENVVMLTDDRAGLGDFVKYFEKWLPNNVEPGATVFVYYSGHGAPNAKTGDAYLVPYDGDPSFIDETGYSLKRMYAALGKLPAKEVVVALDSCFSGAGGRSVIAKGARPLVMNLQTAISVPKNMVVLSASSGDQMSATYDEKGHGLFTYFLLKGIRNEEVLRPDGSLKIDELYEYVKPRVERVARKQYNNEQTPQLIEPKR